MVDEIRVAVIGGGIAGAELVRKAAPRKGLDVTLIEPKDQIEVQALYPEYLVGKAEVDDLSAPLEPFCNRVGATWVRERALSLEDRTVVCPGRRVEYDIVVIAVGARQNYYGIEGAEKTFSINTLVETEKARRFIERTAPERIMIIGSGLTGIEAASVLAETVEDASIYIVEAMDRILPQFPEKASCLVEKGLFEREVNILTSTAVKKVEEDRIHFSDGTSLDCDMAIWTAGIKPPEFLDRLDLPKERGWLKIDPYLRATWDHFAVGDCAWVEGDGFLATKTGIEAERQAAHMARNLGRMVRGEPLSPYSVMAKSDTPLALISTGRSCAVGVYGGMCLAMPSRLIYSLKSWIDKSIAKRYRCSK